MLKKLFFIVTVTQVNIPQCTSNYVKGFHYLRFLNPFFKLAYKSCVFQTFENIVSLFFEILFNIIFFEIQKKYLFVSIYSDFLNFFNKIIILFELMDTCMAKYYNFKLKLIAVMLLSSVVLEISTKFLAILFGDLRA